MCKLHSVQIAQFRENSKCRTPQFGQPPKACPMSTAAAFCLASRLLQPLLPWRRPWLPLQRSSTRPQHRLSPTRSQLQRKSFRRRKFAEENQSRCNAAGSAAGRGAPLKDRNSSDHRRCQSNVRPRRRFPNDQEFCQNPVSAKRDGLEEGTGNMSTAPFPGVEIPTVEPLALVDTLSPAHSRSKQLATICACCS